MHRRKIQLVAGTTYALSLPKEWVKKNHLKEKQDVLIYEEEDNSLSIRKDIVQIQKREKITLCVDEYPNTIGRILFEMYYLGFETIELFSKNAITKDEKYQIRRSLTYMSGTEIIYEDEKKIQIRILLDKSKVNVIQALYRITLLINQSIENIMSEFSISEIEINENEIDRLYHLIKKLLLLALSDSALLQTSEIKHVHIIPHYVLIAKKLENIADSIFLLGQYMHKKKIKTFQKKEEFFAFIKQELHRLVKHILGDYPTVFIRCDTKQTEKITSLFSNLKDEKIIEFLSYAIRFLMDVEEEIITISFYKKLLREKIV